MLHFSTAEKTSIMQGKNLENVADILPFVGSNWKLWGSGKRRGRSATSGGKQLSDVMDTTYHGRKQLEDATDESNVHGKTL